MNWSKNALQFKIIFERRSISILVVTYNYQSLKLLSSNIIKSKNVSNLFNCKPCELNVASAIFLCISLRHIVNKAKFWEEAQYQVYKETHLYFLKFANRLREVRFE